MKKKFKNVVSIIIGVVFVWMILSFFNIIAHNGLGEDHVYWKYNFWSLIAPDNETECESVHRESKELAAHESKKGINLVRISNMPSDEDVELLAHLIYGESGANWCSDEMQWLVGVVVLNRVKSDQFPNTIKEVIFQPGQYACTWDGHFDLEPDERAYEIAEELLIYGTGDVPTNVIGQAQFIYPGLTLYKKVQNMYFCYGLED